LFKERSVKQLRTAKGTVTAMTTTDVVDHVDEHPGKPARREVVCKLFGDRIDGFVCMLRKKALAACEEPSCKGCSLFPALIAFHGPLRGALCTGRGKSDQVAITGALINSAVEGSVVDE
jgi:hypothetical protein